VKSAVETLNPTRVKLTVEVPFDELKPSLDRAYKTISQQVTVPGFRKGKVPPRIIDQRVGRGAVLEEAVNDALPHFCAQAIEEGELHPLGQPSVDVTAVPDPTSGGDLKFTIEVDVRPEITLPDLAAVEVTVDDVEVSEEEVDTRVESLRERFGTLSPVERAVVSDDFVSIDIRAEIDGDEIDSVKGVSYQVGSGNMLPGMDEALPGMAAGETKTFSAPLAGGERAGEDSRITVTVQSVKVRELPALDDDFAQLASEFDSLGELRDNLREQAGTQKKFEQGIQARERLLERLLETVDVPVPDGIITDEVTRHLEGEGRLEDDEHRTEVEAETRKGFKTQLLLDAIAESEHVQVNQQELIEYLISSSQQYGMDPNAFAKAIDEAGQVPAMVEEVARRKALVVVLSRAAVKDVSGNVIDMDALVPSADLADDEVDQDTGALQEIRQPVPGAVAAADPAALPSFDLGGFQPDHEPATDEPAPASEAGTASTVSTAAAAEVGAKPAE
jgi:trigger factor